MNSEQEHYKRGWVYWGAIALSIAHLAYLFRDLMQFSLFFTFDYAVSIHDLRPVITEWGMSAIVSLLVLLALWRRSVAALWLAVIIVFKLAMATGFSLTAMERLPDGVLRVVVPIWLIQALLCAAIAYLWQQGAFRK